MRDKLQTFLLIVLSFLATILMLMLWYTPQKEDYYLEQLEQVISEDDLRKLINVDAVLLSYKGEEQIYYYDVDDLLRSKAKAIAMAMIDYRELIKISSKDYLANYEQDFIEFNFDNAMSAEQFLILMSGKNQEFDLPFAQIDKLLLNESISDSIFIKSKTDYFKISSASFPAISASELSSIKSSPALFKHNCYYPSEALLNFRAISAARELLLDNEREVKILARKVFGSQLDFVQELIDIHGSKVMLYGYGEKALKLSPDGKIYYTQNINSKIKRKSDFYSDLMLAINMIEQLSSVNKENLFLVKVENISEDSAKGFVFHFSYRINNYLVSGQNDDVGVKVEILAGQLKSFSSLILRSEAMQLRSAKSGVKSIVEDSGLNELQSVRALYLVREEVLAPVYCLETEFERYYYSALDYNLIYQEKK